MTNTYPQTSLIVPTGAPLRPGVLYARLLHGRTDPEQEMDGCGFEVPTFGPLAAFEQSYGRTFRLFGTDGRAEVWFDTHEDMIVWNGRYYGDLLVFVAQPVAAPLKPILIEVRGGVVQNVENVPPGYEYEVRDHDDLRDAVTVGYRFRLALPVDRSPDFLAPAGLTGTVTVGNGYGIWARMDRLIPGAGHWNNEIHWDGTDQFLADSEPVST